MLIGTTAPVCWLNPRLEVVCQLTEDQTIKAVDCPVTVNLRGLNACHVIVFLPAGEQDNAQVATDCGRSAALSRAWLNHLHLRKVGLQSA